MATVSYKQLLNPSDNLISLLQEQNGSGAEFGQLKGWEPFEVLVTKALFNAANTGGSLGEVSSVNGLTGVVVLDKSDIGLGNVPNTDATNASNLGSGIVPDARMPNLTGDVTTVEGAVATTLATVNSNVGTFGDSTHVAAVTVNAKGLVTAVSSVAISGGGGSGDVTGPVSSTNTAIAKWSGTGGDTLANTGILIDGSDNITGVNDITLDGTLDLSGATITGGTGTGTVVRATSATITTPTLSGAVQLAESASIRLDAALSADGTFSGITQGGTAGATLAFGDLVYLAVADSRWELADADADATSGAVRIGICVLAAAADGDPTVILTYGNVRADSAFPTLTIGAPVYVSTTAGDVQTAQPSGTDDVIRIVGYGNTADELFFCPSNDYTTHV